MTSPIDSSGLSGMLADAVSALGRLQAKPNDLEEQEPPTGTGEAADGGIHVRAVMPGRVEGLRLDTRAMRLSAEELAREIELAVNGALAELQGQAVAHADAMDFGQLTDQLQEIQFNAERQFAAFAASMADAQEQIVRRADGR
jgi:hypothetical protein